LPTLSVAGHTHQQTRFSLRSGVSSFGFKRGQLRALREGDRTSAASVFLAAGQRAAFRPGRFPAGAQEICLTALTVAADGGKADIAQPLRGFGSGVIEIALPYRGNAFRVVYALLIGYDVWVVHAFQKKSTHGIKTPKHEIDLIFTRVKRLKEMLR
jgi:phage-related protein